MAPRRHRWMVWTAAPLLAAQLGCAARGFPAPAAPSSAAVGEMDEKACEEYSRQQPTKSVAGLRALGVLAVPFSVGLGAASIWLSIMTMQPPQNIRGVDILGLPGEVFKKASGRAEQNRATQEAALHDCLEPLRLQQALGPEHPAVARALRVLANRYARGSRDAQAEPLYRRAMAIQETAIGPDHAELATTLQDYAALLRRGGREAEAAALDARAEAIRTKAAPTEEAPAPEAPAAPEPPAE